MSLNESQAFLVLNALPGIGPVNLRRLLDQFGDDPCAVLEASGSALERVKGVGAKISGAVTSWSEQVNLEKEESRLAHAGARFITCRDDDYPALLRELYDPPIGLYQKGNYTHDHPAIAIVGSRRTTLYGQKVARTLAAELVRAGFCIVSGLARGIDTAAHEGAVEAGGPTVGVLGTGMDIIYPPENLDLYRKVKAAGAVVTEFPFGRRADRQSFAMRNRIVAGMSVGVVVVESDKAGGSMITARFAGEQGRQLFAVPGRIDQSTSAGCHQLIQDGAKLTTCVDDILSEFSHLEGLSPTPIAPSPSRSAEEAAGPPMSADEGRVMACFSGGGRLNADEVAAASSLSIAEVNTALMMLELQRRLAKQPDGRFEAT